MNTMQAPRRPARQNGMALLVALIVLIGVTLISIAGVQTSVMEMRMAANQEANSDTFQTAMAAIDYVLSDSSNLPTSGDLMVPVTVTLPSSVFAVVTGDSITAQALRVADCDLPPRARSGTSVTAFSAFKYEATAAVTKAGSGMGESAMSQGYTLLGPKC